MKKTQNINLGGRSFIIDEDAFRKLDKYVKSVSRKFTRNGSKHDIMEDIEIRMGEVIKEKMDKREIISDMDVDYLIETMGQPEVFASETGNGYHTYSEHAIPDSMKDTKSKRLYRDREERVVAGVCSGLSYYFGIENPVWMRLIFIFAMFAGFSSGFLYVILWIAMPEAKSDSEISYMRNDPVNFDEIKNSLRDEFHEAKDTIQNLVK